MPTIPVPLTDQKMSTDDPTGAVMTFVMAVAGFAVLFLAFRALNIASGEANAATNSSALNATDATFSSLGQATAVTVPPVALVGAIALILAVGYGVVR